MFFSEFPKATYKLLNDYTYTITDFTRYVNLDISNYDSQSYYQFYTIVNGERPDSLSTRFYRTPKYFWSFFLVNEHLKNGYGSWPMSYDELETFIDYEYEGIAIQTEESFWDYDQFQLGSIVTLESNENATGKIHYINKSLNQIVIREISNEEEWLNSEGENLIIEDYDSSTPRFTIKLSTEYKNGISHYEDSDGLVVPITYGLNFNYSGDTDGTIYNQEENLIPIRFEEKERKLNDNRARIRVIKPSKIESFFESFVERINA